MEQWKEKNNRNQQMRKKKTGKRNSLQRQEEKCEVGQSYGKGNESGKERKYQKRELEKESTKEKEEKNRKRKSKKC